MSMQTQDIERIEAERSERQQHQSNAAAGQTGAEDLLSETMRPETIRELSDADITSEDYQFLHRIAGQLLNRDQVFARREPDDLHYLDHHNRALAMQILMSYPAPETRVNMDNPSEREQLQRDIQSRIWGSNRRAMTAEERQKVRYAVAEQKTDRESRAKGGKYQDNVLQQVVRSELGAGDSQKETFWEQLGL